MCILLIVMTVTTCMLTYLSKYSLALRPKLDLLQSISRDIASTYVLRGSKPLIVLGILTRAENICNRNALRNTLVKRAKLYQELDIKVFFVMDHPTSELIEEQNVNRDIVFLKTNIHGWNKHFALKIYWWIMYVLTRYPDVHVIGRMDDDVFVCTPQIFDRLNYVKHDLLYYGYPTGSFDVCPGQDCVDEMFIFIGRTLAQRIANRTLCVQKREPDCLENTADGTGTHIFRYWISIYDDYVFVNEKENNNMVWFYQGTGKETVDILMTYRTWDFCQKYLLYHKASARDLYGMNRQNQKLRNEQSGGLLDLKGAQYSANCTHYLSFK